MKRWLPFVILAAPLLFGFFIGKPYVEARMSWYFVGGRLSGDNLLVTCRTEDPRFNYGGGPWELDAEKPLFSSIEVFLVCNTLEKHADSIVAEKGTWDDRNPTMNDLVEGVARCSHRMFSPEETKTCKSAYFDSIEWLIRRGVDLNPSNSCGYLPSTVFSMDEKMFDFLLSRGADPNHLCPPKAAQFGNGVEQLVDTQPKTIAQLLTALLSEYTDEERSTVVAGWVRMLATVENSTK
jgi:hypothetical protein